MNRNLSKVLKDANEKIKKDNIFKNYRIIVDGDFTSEYNEICLESTSGRRFPIAWAETEGEAAAAINAYVAGLTHGKENSYPRVCDRDNY